VVGRGSAPLDGFIGRDAIHDVYPKMLAHLDANDGGVNPAASG
jgi:hypothetical protein